MALIRQFSAAVIRGLASGSCNCILSQQLTKVPSRFLSVATTQLKPSLQIEKLMPLQSKAVEYGIYSRFVNRLVQKEQVRTRVYQSYKSARPKTVAAVTERFKRLGCGLWIRTRSGRHKHLWRKSNTQRHRMKTHVLCTKRQSWLLERMVGKYWKRHRHYPNDPYAPYHVRNAFSKDKIYHKTPFYP